MLSRLNDTMHLWPAVKTGVARCARATAWLLVAAAVLGVLELALAPLHFVLAAIVCGMGSALLLVLALAFLLPVAAWAHTVLLAGQGMFLPRWLCRMGALLSPVLIVGTLYAFCTGQPLMYRQEELPLLMVVVLVAATTLNWNYMAAAPVRMQLRLHAFPLLLLGCFVTDWPGLLPYCVLFKLLAAWTGAGPLLYLARMAPLVVSLPERESIIPPAEPK